VAKAGTAMDRESVRAIKSAKNFFMLNLTFLVRWLMYYILLLMQRCSAPQHIVIKVVTKKPLLV